MSMPTRGRFVAIDLETTGLSAESDRIVEIGAARFDALGRDLGRFESLVNPLCPVGERARSVHGLEDAELADAPPAAAVLPRFLAWLGEGDPPILLAHNASFDAGFLGSEIAREGLPPVNLAIVDTLAMARLLRPDAPNYRLDTLARLLGLDPDGPHQAMADALRVKGLWLALTGGEVPEAPVAYAIADTDGAAPVPVGWERLAASIAGGLIVRIQYAGGTRGDAPRDITPRRFAHRGGVSYVVALCHVGNREKAFRLDRIARFEAIAPPPP